jgi:hypothetical protein
MYNQTFSELGLGKLIEQKFSKNADNEDGLKVNVECSVADPGSGAFLTPVSGMGKKSRCGSGMYIPDHVSEGLETIFWVKILKFLDADPDQGSEIFLHWIRDQGRKNFGYGIRDKHPGSATLVECLRYQGKGNVKSNIR